MQRAPIVLSTTALGLVATLGFSPHHAATAAAVTASAADTAASSTASTAGTTSSSTSTTRRKRTSSRSTTSTTRIGTSDVVGTQYGNVQLQVTVKGRRIERIAALQLPNNDPKSQQIAAYAEPILTQSALSKQDGTVDAVSGATYTSNGYAQALQSALDKAGFSTATSTSGAA